MNGQRKKEVNLPGWFAPVLFHSDCIKLIFIGSLAKNNKRFACILRHLSSMFHILSSFFLFVAILIHHVSASTLFVFAVRSSNMHNLESEDFIIYIYTIQHPYCAIYVQPKGKRGRAECICWNDLKRLFSIQEAVKEDVLDAHIVGTFIYILLFFSLSDYIFAFSSCWRECMQGLAG